MITTSLSLLTRLASPADAAAWERFVSLYTPLLLGLARRVGLEGQDADDFVQDVLVRLVAKISAYQPDVQHRFRDWLKTIALNAWRDRCRARFPSTGAGLPEVEVDDGVFDLIEAEYLGKLAHRALRIMQADFEPTTWKACWETAVAGRPAAEVGRELGMSASAVYVARSRVLRRLREELDGLLD